MQKRWHRTIQTPKIFVFFTLLCVATKNVPVSVHGDETDIVDGGGTEEHVQRSVNLKNVRLSVLVLQAVLYQEILVINQLAFLLYQARIRGGGGGYIASRLKVGIFGLLGPIILGIFMTF